MAFETGAVLWATAAAALGVVALHLLSWRRPEPRALPTARFVPPAAQRALSRRLSPSDLLLLALRLLAVGAIGLAVAGPASHLRQPGIARVIVADRSRAVASLTEVRDSVERLASEATATRVVVFDSLPTVASDVVWRDSSGSTRRGDLDPALIAAIREAVALRSRFDSVDVVLVSALLAEEVSAGTPDIVAAYGRPVRLASVQSRPATDRPPALAGGAWPPATDPVGAALRLMMGTAPPWLRVSRSELTAADSAHATAGGVVLHWLESPEAPLRNDGVLSASGAVVGAFARLGAPAGTPVAWWSDGRSAAGQEPLGTGCVRHVSIGMPARGDGALRPAFLRLVHDLAAPCDRRDARALSASERAWLTPVASGAAERGAGSPAPLTRRLLLGLAILALIAEWWLRRRRGRNPQFVRRRPSAGGTQGVPLETHGGVA